MCNNDVPNFLSTFYCDIALLFLRGEKMIGSRVMLLFFVFIWVLSSNVLIGGPVAEDFHDKEIRAENFLNTPTRSQVAELLWEYATDNWIFSSPAIADLDNDGDLDIVFGNGVHDSRGQGGAVIALNNEGEELWNFSTGSDFPASPVVYDLFGDSYPEVLIGDRDIGFYCLNGAEGTLLWKYAIGRCESSAAVEDIDLDGSPEIVICGQSGLVVLDRNGKVEWKGKGNYRCAPTIADLDGDGDPEVISCDMDTIHVYRGNGSLKWSTYVGWYVASSPGIGDLNGDGVKDIVVGRNAGGLFAVSGNSDILWESDLGSGIYTSSPAMFDMDRDGHLEIFVETQGQDSKLYALSHEGGIQWSCDLGNGYSSPAIADVNNDGVEEILAGNWGGGVFSYDGDGNKVLIVQTGQVASSPIVADLTGDGFLEVITSSTKSGSDSGLVQCFSLNTSCDVGEIIWGSFQHSSYNTGNPLIRSGVNPDFDGDGFGNGLDAFPRDPTQWVDWDGDGYGDNPDGNEPDAYPEDPDEWKDSDSDGFGDNCDEFPEDPEEWQDTDGDGVGENSDDYPEDPDEWRDTDGDGVGDNGDMAPEDPAEWEDKDGDGHGDNGDQFPNDPFEWIDTDGDGVGDNRDDFPDDPNRSKDNDGDGYADEEDEFPHDQGEWEDTDDDGVGDNKDQFPHDPTEHMDSDLDGVGDNEDDFPMDMAASLDTDGDGYPNEWNIGMSEEDSTTGLVLDLFPDDPNKFEKRNNFVLLIIILITIILVFIGMAFALLFFNNRGGYRDADIQDDGSKS
jgi:VCBS repeat protein